jgi:cation transport ATPase
LASFISFDYNNQFKDQFNNKSSSTFSAPNADERNTYSLQNQKKAQQSDSNHSAKDNVIDKTNKEISSKEMPKEISKEIKDAKNDKGQDTGKKNTDAVVSEQNTDHKNNLLNHTIISGCLSQRCILYRVLLFL